MRTIDRVLHQLMFRDFAGPWTWPKDFDPEGWERIAFPGPHRSPLAGVFGRAIADRSRGIVVCIHPVRPDAKGYFLRSGVADVLRQAGFDVLAVDINGFGESPFVGGDYAGDVLAAAREAQRRTPGAPMLLFGACFGAGVALPLLVRPDHPFDAVVIEGAPDSWDDFYRSGGGPVRSLRQRWIRWRGRVVVRLMALLYPNQAALLHAQHHLKKARRLRGVLFLYGEGDPLIPAQVGEELYAACRTAWGTDGPVCQFWKTRTTRHLTYYQADPDGYRAALFGFLDGVVKLKSAPAS